MLEAIFSYYYVWPKTISQKHRSDAPTNIVFSSKSWCTDTVITLCVCVCVCVCVRAHTCWGVMVVILVFQWNLPSRTEADDFTLRH